MSDYISREAAIENIRVAGCTDCGGNSDDICGFCDFENAVRLVNGLPAADVEPVRHGWWEECDWVDVDEHGFGTRRTFKAGLRCSQCACVFKKKLLWERNYCPSCGSKMDLEV
nr:MAG TPA: DNA-directed RNA polymerase [Bacteriophage sp.]